MKTILSSASVLVLTLAVAAPVTAQVLIGGGGTPATSTYDVPTPVAVVPVVYAVPVPYIQPPCASAVILASGGCQPTANVLYVGGPNSHLKNCYQGQAYAPACAAPNVIYFGRGEAYERGYAFRRHR